MDHLDPEIRPLAGAEPRATIPVFLDAARLRIIADLIAHLGRGSGPMVLVGEVGSGKTTLLRQVADEAAARRLPLILAAQTSARSAALLAMFAGIEAQAKASPSGWPTGILIDDAEECPVAVWHKLANLLGDSTHATALPPIILALTPEMLSWLKDLVLIGPGTFESRIRRLPPLAPVEVAQFLRHRLGAVGHAPPEIFPAHAIERITAATGGMPGRLCQLCDDVLATAGIRGGGRVSAEMLVTALSFGIRSDAAATSEHNAEAAKRLAGRPQAMATNDGASGAEAEADAIGSIDATGREAPSHVRAAGLPHEPATPLFAADYLPEGFYRSRRRRRWPRIAAFGAVCGIGVLGVFVAFQAQRPHYTFAPLPDDGRAAATGPVIPGRPDVASVPAPVLQGALIPPTSPAAAVPSIAELPTPTRGAPQTIRDEEAPEIFFPTPVARRGPPTPSSPPPPAPKAVKATSIPATTGVAGTTAKVPPATRRPLPIAEAPQASPDGETEPAPEATAGPPRPVKEIIDMGDEFRDAGDIELARKYYQVAGERGSAKATRALAATYDPRYVNSGESPDPEVARQLYERAARRGDRGAAKERDDLDQWLGEGR